MKLGLRVLTELKEFWGNKSFGKLNEDKSQERHHVGAF